MREADIKGLGSQQIQDKFSLPQPPTSVLPVNIPGGQKIQASTASSALGNSGGGVQFQLVLPKGVKPPDSWFDMKNSRPLK